MYLVVMFPFISGPNHWSIYFHRHFDSLMFCYHPMHTTSLPHLFAPSHSQCNIHIVAELGVFVGGGIGALAILGCSTLGGVILVCILLHLT